MKKIILALPVLLILTLSACNTVETPTAPQAINESTSQANTGCETACENYKTQCLSLVPGATQQIFKDGIESCMNECKAWTKEKTDCISTSLDCVSMTDICEL